MHQHGSGAGLIVCYRELSASTLREGARRFPRSEHDVTSRAVLVATETSRTREECAEARQGTMQKDAPLISHTVTATGSDAVFGSGAVQASLSALHALPVDRGSLTSQGGGGSGAQTPQCGDRRRTGAQAAAVRGQERCGRS